MEQSEVIRHMVNDILSDKSADAMEKFNSMMATRVSDALDTKNKIWHLAYTRIIPRNEKF